MRHDRYMGSPKYLHTFLFIIPVAVFSWITFMMLNIYFNVTLNDVINFILRTLHI